MSTAKVSVVASKLQDIFKFFGQLKTSWPTIPLPFFVPELDFDTRIYTRRDLACPVVSSLGS